MQYVVVQPVNLLPILGLIALIVLSLLWVTSKRNGQYLLSAAVLLLLWASLIGWMFIPSSAYRFFAH